ncbi:DUF6284 family protein [Micromonospora sp. WMMD956]|uniref:DUF6284 family protein n=1 Tax=Micromonospora sp. WMMD956 TaxID=3016108 RepID=UPI0024176199|nr:DUF6284 family protein [Micromonospora sp. WMMD956]MDG4815177.1 DUF6284 family protein [Micromonospora sp. WMMD956]
MTIDHDAAMGPAAADLAAIEQEWPLIAADLDLLDAEIAMLYAADDGGPTALDWRRLRRAESRVTRAAAEVAARPAHVCNLIEVRLTTDCRYGCKILACRVCGGEQVSHRAVYGCPAGQNATPRVA